MYHVLVVCTDNTIQTQMLKFIKHLHPEINLIFVDNPDEISSTVLKNKIDAIACYHKLPELDAIRVFKNRCKEGDFSPFIIFTEGIDSDIAMQVIEMDIDNYIPFRKDPTTDYARLGTAVAICAEKGRLTVQNIHTEKRLKSLVTMAEMSDCNFSEIMDYALETSVSLTSSTIGYVSTYDPHTKVVSMLSWSRGGISACNMKDREINYELGDMGVWGDPIRLRKSVIINDYSNSSEYKKGGIPLGHVSLNKLLMVPIFNKGVIVGTAGVGNKTTDYDEEDEKQLSLLMNSLMSIYINKNIEKEYYKNEENFRHDRIT